MLSPPFSFVSLKVKIFFKALIDPFHCTFSFYFIYFCLNLCFLSSINFGLYLFFLVLWGVKLGRLRFFCFLMKAFIIMSKFPRTAFMASHKFWYLVFPFSFAQDIFFNFSLSFLTHWFSAACCSISVYL